MVSGLRIRLYSIGFMQTRRQIFPPYLLQFSAIFFLMIATSACVSHKGSGAQVPSISHGDNPGTTSTPSKYNFSKPDHGTNIANMEGGNHLSYSAMEYHTTGHATGRKYILNSVVFKRNETNLSLSPEETQ